MAKAVTLIKICFVIILIMHGQNAEAKNVLSLQDIKEKIIKNEIYIIYVTDGGIEGIEKNKFGVASENFIAIGTYEKIPDDIHKLAQKHNVQIAPSQKSSVTINRPRTFIQILISVLYIGLLPVILLFLILIYRRLSKIIQILSK